MLLATLSTPRKYAERRTAPRFIGSCTPSRTSHSWRGFPVHQFPCWLLDFSLVRKLNELAWRHNPWWTAPPVIFSISLLVMCLMGTPRLAASSQTFSTVSLWGPSLRFTKSWMSFRFPWVKASKHGATPKTNSSWFSLWRQMLVTLSLPLLGSFWGSGFLRSSKPSFWSSEETLCSGPDPLSGPDDFPGGRTILERWPEDLKGLCLNRWETLKPVSFGQKKILELWYSTCCVQLFLIKRENLQAGLHIFRQNKMTVMQQYSQIYNSLWSFIWSGKIIQKLDKEVESRNSTQLEKHWHVTSKHTPVWLYLLSFSISMMSDCTLPLHVTTFS